MSAPYTYEATRTFRGDEAAEQGDEADEAWSTSELRSLSPVFDGQTEAMASTVVGYRGGAAS
jgi:hypothetical protein